MSNKDEQAMQRLMDRIAAKEREAPLQSAPVRVEHKRIPYRGIRLASHKSVTGTFNVIGRPVG